MADDNQDPLGEHEADRNDEDNDVHAPDKGEDSGEPNGADEEVTEVEDEDELDGPPPRVTLSLRNAAVPGHMVISYAARDVVIPMDGDAAIRLLAMFRSRSERGLADYLDPYTSDARAAWVVLDVVDEPLAMSWVPGLPSPRRRTAIDPAVVA